MVFPFLRRRPRKKRNDLVRKAMAETIRYSYKLVVVGDPSVGKTSLIRRYTDKKFDASYLPTIGADFTIKKLEFQKDANTIQQVTLAIWDMGGHTRFHRIRDHYYLDSSAALVVCDLSRKETFENLETWLSDLETRCGSVPILVLANKNDLPEKAVSQDDIDQFSSEKKLEVLKTSAKTGENVDKIFDTIARHCLETYD